MSNHTKAGRRRAPRAPEMWNVRSVALLNMRGAGWEIMAWTPDEEIGKTYRLSPDEWARFCALIGVDPETGEALMGVST